MPMRCTTGFIDSSNSHLTKVSRFAHLTIPIPSVDSGRWKFRSLAFVFQTLISDQTYLQGDASLVVLIGGVVRDLDWTKEVLVKKSHTSETHSDFPGCLKKCRFSPANLCEGNFPRASPGWEVPPPLPPAQITIEL